LPVALLRNSYVYDWGRSAVTSRAMTPLSERNLLMRVIDWRGRTGSSRVMRTDSAATASGSPAFSE
jgi:hypothetical protein